MSSVLSGGKSWKSDVGVSKESPADEAGECGKNRPDENSESAMYLIYAGDLCVEGVDERGKEKGDGPLRF